MRQGAFSLVGPIAAVAASLALATGAAATIIPLKSIGGVSVGMSEKQVRTVLGTPRSVQNQGDSARYIYAGYAVLITKGVVRSIFTFSPRERTSSGIGVGSTEKALLQRVKGLRCSGKTHERSCFATAQTRAGTIVMAFVLLNGRVTGVQLSLATPRRK